MNPLRAIKNQIYFLQLENYNVKRYLRLFPEKIWLPGFRPRQPIIWTDKLKLITFGSLFLQALTSGLLAFLIFPWPVSLFIFLILFILLSYFHFIFLSLWILSYPIDYFGKSQIIKKAEHKIWTLKNLKVIGITGSYGKTTMKEVLAAVLEEKFKVLKTPENINTPVGIGRLILSDLTEETDVFIVEMGAYERGDIKKLTDLVHPKISILTGINEAHLERFGSIENTIATKFELIDGTDPQGDVVLNADDKLVVENYKRHTQLRNVHFISSTNNPLCRHKVVDKKFLANGAGISFSLETHGKKMGPFKIPFLSEYIFGPVVAAVGVAHKLGLTPAEIKNGIAKIKPVPHRLNPIRNESGILVIDDSYNGNPDGAREAIKALARFKKERKIFVTPGLVEMGERTESVHKEIGQALAKVADLVILIRTEAARFIAQGLTEQGFKPDDIMWFESTEEAYSSLTNILKAGDVVLFQNDWPDNYR
ncbi:MAG: UDP-N-acetylmuramoyl-tripeptide--D-alanyl-D-alanine ligase [Candidatus Colwellbacteria bacterium]|nr:UDP-N-acetylmuramoyl-tripeptide--D-alanyl-D-alanine ligase [Candidatus Colwellbacteria bacterium]